MGQTLHPLFGSAINDNEVSRSIGLPAGVYEGLEPAIAGSGGSSGWTATLAVDSKSGRSLWRTAGDLTNGRYVIEEDSPVQVHIAGPSASPRIDLIIGIHKWAEGPIDPVSLEPTGAYTASQQPTYAVVSGTPATTPVDPSIPDPYDGTGKRAVILARVTVPTSGAATIERYQPTDLRLDYMRSLVGDIVDARSPYSSLKQRIDALGSATQVQSINFSGPVPETGSNSVYQNFSPTMVKKYGSAVSQRNAYSFSLNEPGLYEVIVNYRVDSVSLSSGSLAMRAFLGYNAGTTVTLDFVGDTSQQEYTGTLYAQVYVDSSWTDPFVWFDRAGWPDGTFRGSIKYLGTPSTLDPLSIEIGDQSATEPSGQTYPYSTYTNLIAANGVGSLTWSIVSGGGGLDGSSEPKAEIYNSNTLKITWSTQPSSFPQSYSINLSVTDSASSPRTATKTIAYNYGATPSLSITNADITIYSSAYPDGVLFTPLATGGKTPYTWAIVVGADTTLDSASYDPTANFVSGSMLAEGTSTVRLRCTDGNATVVEKVISIQSIYAPYSSGGGGCVPEGTLLETVDGPLAIQDVAKGMLVRAYDDISLEPILATVEEVFVYEDRQMAVLHTDSISLRCSRDHRVYRLETRETRGLSEHWPPVEELVAGDHTLVESDGKVVSSIVSSVELLDEKETVYHVRLSSGHVYVAGGVLAHNNKAADVPL